MVRDETDELRRLSELSVVGCDLDVPVLPFTPVRDYTWRAFSYGAFNFNEHALSSAFTWTNPAHVVTIFGGEIFNYTNFVIDPEFTFSPFSLRWTFNYTAYELIRTYSFRRPQRYTIMNVSECPRK